MRPATRLWEFFYDVPPFACKERLSHVPPSAYKGLKRNPRRRRSRNLVKLHSWISVLFTMCACLMRDHFIILSVSSQTGENRGCGRAEQLDSTYCLCLTAPLLYCWPAKREGKGILFRNLQIKLVASLDCWSLIGKLFSKHIPCFSAMPSKMRVVSDVGTAASIRIHPSPP